VRPPGMQLPLGGGGPLGPTSDDGTKATPPVEGTRTCSRGPAWGTRTRKYCQLSTGPNWTALSSCPDHTADGLKVSTQKGRKPLLGWSTSRLHRRKDEAGIDGSIA